MKGPRPIELSAKTGVIGFLLLIGTLIGAFKKWQDFHDFFLPKDDLLNWRFFVAAILGLAALVWFVMNALWQNENVEREKATLDRDNFRALLSESEKKRRTGVITGIPNGTQLIEDLDTFFALRENLKEAYVILIDIKGFRKVNQRFGYLKGDALLRMIAQSIYTGMRRNEDMYKHPTAKERDKAPWKQYRRYPGGDEFVFIVEGTQADAVGFVVKRLYPLFKTLTKKTADLLKVEFPLSFHCAVAPVTKRDKATDVFLRLEDCYTT